MLVGYGKMGKEIEKILLERNHTIGLILDNAPTVESIKGKSIDVAIEFSMPEVAFDNIQFLMENKIPTVIGTTGWLDRKQEIEKLCIAKGTALLQASNFSLGVNLFFNMNAYLAKLMKGHEDLYHIKTQEIHHTQKLDAPSGTAITLAKGIIDNSNYTDWNLGTEAESDKHIPIEAIREDPAPGTHKVYYQSEIDEIEIIHTAKSRKGFALGAVLAAEYIHDKKGIFSMSDVLGLPKI